MPGYLVVPAKFIKCVVGAIALTRSIRFRTPIVTLSDAHGSSRLLKEDLAVGRNAQVLRMRVARDWNGIVLGTSWAI